MTQQELKDQIQAYYYVNGICVRPFPDNPYYPVYSMIEHAEVGSIDPNGKYFLVYDLYNKRNGKHAPFYISLFSTDESTDPLPEITNSLSWTMEEVPWDGGIGNFQVNVKLRFNWNASYQHVLAGWLNYRDPVPHSNPSEGAFIISWSPTWAESSVNQDYILVNTHYPYDLSGTDDTTALTLTYDIFSNIWEGYPFDTTVKDGSSIKAEYLEIRKLGYFKATDIYNPSPSPVDPPIPPTPTGDGMELELWKDFKKRKNSTKRPTNGTIVNVLLKHDTSILAPHFILNSQEFNYNYCKFNGRYYYIEDTISLNNGTIELVCKVDPLASWKTEIFNTETYVERNGSMGQSNIFDPLFPPTIDYEKAHKALFNWRESIGSDTTQYYVMAIVSSDSGSQDANGVTYYGITDYTLTEIMRFVGNNDFGTGWRNQLNDLRGCLLSLKKVPFVPQGTTSDIYIGGEALPDIGGIKLSESPLPFGTNGFIDITNTFPSRAHDEAYSYLDLPPYSMGVLYLPWVGMVELDLKYFAPTTFRRIKIVGYIDQITADVVYKIYCKDNDTVIATYSGNCGADLPIASQHYNPMGVVSSTIQTVGGVTQALASVPAMASGIGILGYAGGVSQTAQGITNMINSFALHTQVNGSLSSYIGSALDNECWIEIFTHIPPTWALDSVKSKMGLLFNRMEILSNCAPFAKTYGCKVNMAGTEFEKDVVNATCDSGIYLE